MGFLHPGRRPLQAWPGRATRGHFCPRGGRWGATRARGVCKDSKTAGLRGPEAEAAGSDAAAELRAADPTPPGRVGSEGGLPASGEQLQHPREPGPDLLHDRGGSQGAFPPEQHGWACTLPVSTHGGRRGWGERAAALAGVTRPREVSCRCFLPAARGWETLLQAPGSRAGCGPRAAPRCVSPGVQRAVWHLGARRSRVHICRVPARGRRGLHILARGCFVELAHV